MHPLTLLFYLLLLLIIYWISFAFYKISISAELIKNTIPYSLPGEDYTQTLLVLGDSTAVGVGASSPTDSIPAKLSKHLGATYVENLAVSGATVNDLPGQMKLISKEKYTTVLVQIGANDITRFHGIEKVSINLESILTLLKSRSDRVIFLSAGNMGGALTIPPPLRPFYTRLNLKYHDNFEALGKKLNITYVNMYMEPKLDPFIQDPKKYFAKDSFHPSTAGYEIWFNTIKEKLTK